jgi:hypothetical protein
MVLETICIEFLILEFRGISIVNFTTHFMLQYLNRTLQALIVNWMPL